MNPGYHHREIAEMNFEPPPRPKPTASLSWRSKLMGLASIFTALLLLPIAYLAFDFVQQERLRPPRELYSVRTCSETSSDHPPGDPRTAWPRSYCSGSDRSRPQSFQGHRVTYSMKWAPWTGQPRRVTAGSSTISCSRVWHEKPISLAEATELFGEKKNRE